MTVSLQLQEDILGLCLIRDSEYLAVAAKLTAEHFPDKRCGAIWKTIHGLYQQGIPVTDSLIEQRTEWSGDDVSILAYLFRLRGNAPEEGVHADELSHDLIDAWFRNKFRLVAKDLPALADKRDLTGEELIEEASRTLNKAFEDQAPSGMYTPSMFAASLERKASGQLKAGEEIYTGFEPLDDMLAPIQPGDVVVAGGATSSGKSSLVQMLAWKAAQNGTPVLFITNEMTGEQAFQRMCAQISGQPLEAIMGYRWTNNGTREAIDTATNQLKSLPIYVDQSEKDTVAGMRLKIMRFQRMENVRLVVIDHLQFIRPDNKRDSEYEQLAQITSDIKACAKELGIPIILVSHFNRAGSNRTNSDAVLAKALKRPFMGDLHGSSSIEKDADAVIVVHRPEYWLERNAVERDHPQYYDQMSDIDKWKGKAELILLKRRQGKGYQRKLVRFHGETTLFSTLSNEQDRRMV